MIMAYMLQCATEQCERYTNHEIARRLGYIIDKAPQDAQYQVIHESSRVLATMPLERLRPWLIARYCERYGSQLPGWQNRTPIGGELPR